MWKLIEIDQLQRKSRLMYRRFQYWDHFVFIFINDLQQVALNNNIDFTLFADDSIFTAYDKFDALNVLRNEIPEIKKGFETNRLQLNSNKSKTFVFSSAKKIVPCP